MLWHAVHRYAAPQGPLLASQEGTSMTGVDWVFLVSAIVGGCLFLVRLIMMLVGLGHGGVDFSHGDIGGVDLSHGPISGESSGDSDMSFKLLTIQGVTAFFMMFGLVGLAMRRENAIGPGWSVLGALAAGLLAVYIVDRLFALMKRLQSSGTLNMQNAVGQEGLVYLNIPADGLGKVQVAVQGRQMVLEANAEDKMPIKTGERVKVVQVVSGNVMVVKKV
jgi:membrane protein implicated in regulation of membrane protease activity